EPVPQPNQEIDVGDAPDPPGDGAAQLEPAEIDHREPFADLRQAAGMAVAEWRRRAAGEPRLDGLRNMAALLLGGRGDARNRPAVPGGNSDGVADRKDLGMAGYGKIRRNLEPSRAIGRCAKPFGGARGAHAGRPDDGFCVQWLAAID